MGSPALAPYGAYPTGDGQVVVLGTTNDAEWQRLTAMIERPDLADDERLRRNPDRVVHREEVDAAVSAWCAGRDLADIQVAADQAGIGNARYNTPLDVVDHPQLVQRGRWQDSASPVGPVAGLLPPPLIAGRPFSMGAVPALGEHTTAVLGELGFTHEEIATLREAGAV